MRARNPVLWPKMGIQNRGFRALVQNFRKFVKWDYKKHTHAMSCRCAAHVDAQLSRAEHWIPIFDASFWPENVVSCPQCGHERNKIGDSVLCSRVSMDVLYFLTFSSPKPEHGIADFDASFWSENGVSCPQCGHERNKIGDSVLCPKP
jgi:Zn ribbon nucleic-acid-binding protein